MVLTDFLCVCVCVCVCCHQRDEGEEGDMDEEVAIPFPNLMEVAGALEQGGVGLGKEETFRILLALRALLREHTTLQSVRFWGEMDM